MAIVRRSKSECPLCRQNIPDTTELVINRELRDLVSLASALHTVDQDGWEAVTSNKTLTKSRKLEADADGLDVTLVPTAPPVYVSLSTVLQGGGDLLSLEPPTWLPDSHAQECGNCQQTFRWASLLAAAVCLYAPARRSYAGSTLPMHFCTSTASTQLCQTAQCRDGSKSDCAHGMQSPEALTASLPTVWRHLLCKLLLQSTTAASQVPAATTPKAL